MGYISIGSPSNKKKEKEKALGGGALSSTLPNTETPNPHLTPRTVRSETLP